jgi:hypothetical protein
MLCHAVSCYVDAVSCYVDAAGEACIEVCSFTAGGDALPAASSPAATHLAHLEVGECYQPCCMCTGRYGNTLLTVLLDLGSTQPVTAHG